MTEQASRRESTRDAIRAVGVAAVALAVVYHPLLLGRSVLSRDLGAWTVPARGFVREALAHGRLPEWCPWEGIGFPTAADPLFAPFYPVSLLTLPLPVAWGTSLYCFLHVLIGATGMFALTRRLGSLSAASAVGALSWSLSGVAVSEWDGGVRLMPAAWFPWAIYAAWALAAASARGRSLVPATLGLGLTGGLMILTGEVFVALMGAMAALVGATASALQAPPPTQGAPRSFRLAGALGLAGALALALGAPTWLPAVTLVGASPRGVAFGSASSVGWSMHPLLLVDLVVGRGSVHLLNALGLDAARRLLDPVQLYPTVYLGAATVALGALAPSRNPRAPWTSFVALGALGLLLALGRHTPVHALFVLVVRPFARMQSPEKFVLLVHLSVSVLAALGADRVLRGRGAPWRLAALAGSIALALTWIALAVSAPIGAQLVRGASWSLLGIAGVALAARLVPRLGARAAVALPIVVALDLAPHAMQAHHWEDGAFMSTRPPLAARVVDRGVSSGHGAAPPRLWRSPAIDDVTAPGVAGVAAQRRALLRPKFNLDLGIALLPGYEAAISEEVNRLARSGRTASLRLLSVDLALTRSAHPPDMSLVGEVAPGARLFAVDAPLPRAFVAYTSVDDGPPGRLSHLLVEPVISGQAVAMRPDGATRGLSGPPRPPTHCAIQAWAPGDVTLRCDAAAAGIAVLVEAWVPGWSATVDESPRAPIQVNRVAVGVPIGAGPHVVRLVYRTPRLRIGLLLAAIGAAVMTAAAASLRRKGAPRDANLDADSAS